jgi:hypothetical protein
MTKSKKVVLSIAIVILFLVALGIWWLDSIFYRIDNGCESDKLPFICQEFFSYAKRHGGSYPSSLEELKTDWHAHPVDLDEDIGFGSDWMLTCSHAKKPMVWKPNFPSSVDGNSVIVACPLVNHGLVRRYSWAIVMTKEGPHYVKINMSGKALGPLQALKRIP